MRDRGIRKTMLSYWEQESFARHDFVVVGGGVIGLSAALSLRDRFPAAAIAVIERDPWPGGASLRNVGFLSVSTLSEVVADRRELGESAALGILTRRRDGIARLRKRLGDTAIGYEPHGGYELLREAELGVLDECAATNRWLRPIFGDDVFRPRNDRIAAFGFPDSIRGLVFNPFDAQVHTGQVLRALLRLAGEKGILVIGGAEVVALDEDAGGVALSLGAQRPAIRAGRVAVCTSAWISRLVPEVGIRPARGQVLITEPVDRLPWRGTFNFDQGYLYFRDVGRRVIVGGARNTDREAETTASAELNPRIHAILDRVLADIVLPGRKTVVESRWAGIMGFAEPRCPIVRLRSDRIAVGFGCNSMGLAMGSAIGDELAALF